MHRHLRRRQRHFRHRGTRYRVQVQMPAQRHRHSGNPPVPIQPEPGPREESGQVRPEPLSPVGDRRRRRSAPRLPQKRNQADAVEQHEIGVVEMREVWKVRPVLNQSIFGRIRLTGQDGQCEQNTVGGGVGVQTLRGKEER